MIATKTHLYFLFWEFRSCLSLPFSIVKFLSIDSSKLLIHLQSRPLYITCIAKVFQFVGVLLSLLKVVYLHVELYFFSCAFILQLQDFVSY